MGKAQCMTRGQLDELKSETESMFYHGFDNYMKHAFPEDELRPISCMPLSRDRDNPAHIEVNDVLGNYSLTLIDSLSTLAILASSPPTSSKRKNKALRLFEDAVRDIVTQYGDGSEGVLRCGKRTCGFDLDSKVQVFETVIRGVGGLLSAHLFAVGDLPIRGYTPVESQVTAAKLWNGTKPLDKHSGIRWSNGFTYNGQLLRLAYDLGTRLIPAFWTATGIPYPRVNLRHGIPFYSKSPLNFDPAEGECDTNNAGNSEITETCSAGAGSLVLEFTVLSRLTGDERFESLAKRAFWSIWARRSEIDLIGSGIDAENGQWVSPYTGIGAGIDSFFEYALKSHILLSREGKPPTNIPLHAKDPRELFKPLSAEEESTSAFLQTWVDSHEAIKRHLYRGSGYQHPHYIQGDLFTGATRALWLDSLSAYYPGLLTLAGEIEEASETHLLTTALWNRYSALPERWNVASGDIEGGLGWWIGRPEFVESNWYLYRATKDPWYLYVAEMVLRDIKRRCWTKCGWAGIQDVRTGELNDRMESFFLGETAKYLFLTFEPDHPLNHFDAPFVFTTEGHPLIIPADVGHIRRPIPAMDSGNLLLSTYTCPLQADTNIFIPSHTGARQDLFHAASLARLDLMPARSKNGSPLTPYSTNQPSISISDLQSPSNYTYFPWTLPADLIPWNATSALIAPRPTFDISFPPLPNMQPSLAPLQRVREGIFINSVGGLRLAMIQDMPIGVDGVSGKPIDGYRIQAINNLALGKDEKVYLAKDPTFGVLNPMDPNFTRVKDLNTLELVIDVPDLPHNEAQATATVDAETLSPAIEEMSPKGPLKSLLDQLTSVIKETKSLASEILPPFSQNITRYYLGAMLPTGLGAAPIPEWAEAPSLSPQHSSTSGLLSWNTVFVTGDACTEKLPLSIPRTHQVIVMKRGGCSFSRKIANIPAFAPSPTSLQLVIVVSYEAEDGMPEGWLARPLLDKQQFTSGGLPRHNPIPMVLVGGGEDTYTTLQRALGVGVKRKYSMEAQGVPIRNLIIT